MSRNLTSWMLDKLDQPSTNLAACVGIDITDGSGLQYSFTDHDLPVPFQGRTYVPTAGAVVSAYSGAINLSVDNMSVVGIIDAAGGGIRDEDIESGRMYYADVSLFFVDYTDPDTGGPIILLNGKSGRIKRQDNRFVIELRGIAQYYQQIIGEPYTVGCKAFLGDARCGIDTNLPEWTKTMTVGQIIGPRVYETNLTDGDKFYQQGVLVWTVGDNEFFVSDVKASLQLDGRIELYEPPPFNVQVTDQAKITGGCLRDEAACKDKTNYRRYRGFPHIKGISRSS